MAGIDFGYVVLFWLAASVIDAAVRTDRPTAMFDSPFSPLLWPLHIIQWTIAKLTHAKPLQPK